MFTASTLPTESTDVRIVITVQLIRTGSVNRALQLTVVGRPYKYTVFQKKTSTHIIGYKLGNSCLILIIFDVKIPHII